MVSLSALTANFRHRASGGVVRRTAKFVNAAGTAGSDFGDVNDANGAYADTGPVDVFGAAYRPTGGSWVVGDFDDETSIFGGIKFESGNPNSALVTSFWGSITYIAPAGGFTFLLNLAGLGALPFVGHLADLAQFSRYLSWRRAHHPRHTLLTPDETRQAWRELRAYRHPRFFLPAVA